MQEFKISRYFRRGLGDRSEKAHGKQRSSPAVSWARWHGERRLRLPSCLRAPTCRPRVRVPRSSLPAAPAPLPGCARVWAWGREALPECRDTNSLCGPEPGMSNRAVRAARAATACTCRGHLGEPRGCHRGTCRTEGKGRDPGAPPGA